MAHTFGWSILDIVLQQQSDVCQRYLKVSIRKKTVTKTKVFQFSLKSSENVFLCMFEPNHLSIVFPVFTIRVKFFFYFHCRNNTICWCQLCRIDPQIFKTQVNTISAKVEKKEKNRFFIFFDPNFSTYFGIFRILLKMSIFSLFEHKIEKFEKNQQS